MLKKISWIVLLTLLLLFIPRLSGTVASFFNYSAVDPDGSYAWISVHHIVQALIFSVLMAILSKFRNIDYGFRWGDRAAGRQYVLTFSFFFFIYTAGAFLTIFLTDSFQLFEYPLTAVNIIGQLSFQLLLSGPSEELIFRAFAITMLALMIKGRILNGRLSYANIIAAVIFGLAHVGFSFAPFDLNYSAFQVIYSMVLGLFYGDCYEKTGSVYYPMMMHSITNVLMVGIIIIASLLTN